MIHLRRLQPQTRRILAIGLTTLLTACGGDSKPPTAPALVLTTLSVSLSSGTLAAGQTTTATAAGLDQNGGAIAVGAVAWSSSAPAVASVTQAGVVTGAGAGTAQIIAAAGGKQGQTAITVTQPVVTVTITPATPSVGVSATQQLTATTLDAVGATLTGRIVVWSTSNPAIATVSPTGSLAGVAIGGATITATSEGKSGTATVTVSPPPVFSVSVSPSNASVPAGSTQALTATLRDAAGNTLTGRTISWSTSDAATATVNASTGVVTGVAAGSATITATSEGKTGSSTIGVTAVAPVCSPGTALQLTLGEVRVLTTQQKASLCLGAAAATEYVLIPFNTSTIAASQTQIDFAGTNTTAITSPAPNIQSFSANVLTGAQLAPDNQSMELAFRQRERQQLAGLAARAPRPNALRITGVPATPVVGSVYSMNASLSGNLCTAQAPSALHGARVVAVLPHAIVFVDTLAPTGGYSDAELLAFGTNFDTLGFVVDTLNFGTPSDIDGNGRVGIFFTPGVNVIPGPPGGFVGGLFSSRDLYTAALCAGSNEGEMFYLPVPDPGSTINGNYTNKVFLGNLVLGTLVHEFQHLINAGRRMYVNGAASQSEEIWLNEGLSHIAEEMLYYRVSGNSPRANIVLSTLQSSAAQTNAFNANQQQNFSRLGSYLAAPSANSPYAQADGLAMRGAVWQFLRYSADRKGGTERSIWFALVNSTTSGTPNFNAVFGDLTTNARDWAVAQFLDDAGLGAAANYTHASWNYRSIFPALTNPSRFPLATVPLVGITPASVTLAGGGAAYVRFRVGAGAVATVAGSSSGQQVPASIDFILVRTQ